MVHGDGVHQAVVVVVVAAAVGSQRVEEAGEALAVTGDGAEVVAEASQEAADVVVTVVTADEEGVHRLYAADVAWCCCRIVYYFLRDFRSFSTAKARSIRSRSLPTVYTYIQDQTLQAGLESNIPLATPRQG